MGHSQFLDLIIIANLWYIVLKPNIQSAATYKERAAWLDFGHQDSCRRYNSTTDLLHLKFWRTTLARRCTCSGIVIHPSRPSGNSYRAPNYCGCCNFTTARPICANLVDICAMALARRALRVIPLRYPNYHACCNSTAAGPISPVSSSVEPPWPVYVHRHGPGIPVGHPNYCKRCNSTKPNSICVISSFLETPKIGLPVAPQCSSLNLAHLNRTCQCSAMQFGISTCVVVHVDHSLNGLLYTNNCQICCTLSIHLSTFHHVFWTCSLVEKMFFFCRTSQPLLVFCDMYLAGQLVMNST